MGLAHSPSIVTSGLVFCVDPGNTKSYPGSGTVLTDITGRLNNGTLINSPTFGSNVFTFANDVTKYVSFNSSTDLNPSAITIDIWVNFAVLGTRIIFCGKGDGASNLTTQYWMEKTTANLVSIYMGIGSSGNNHTLSSSSITATSTWYNIVGTFDGSTIRGYVNGIQDPATGSLVGSLNTTSIIYSYGKLGTYGGQGMNGSMSVNKIYNRALSSAEILQNFNALRGRFGV